VARFALTIYPYSLPDTEVAGALQIGESMRRNVINLEILHAQSLVADYVTISVGVADMDPIKDKEPDTLLKIADTSLCKAKRESRNICKTCNAEELLNL